MSAHNDSIAADILRLSSLLPGWDGAQAPGINQDALAHAAAIAYEACRTPNLTPGSDGGVLLTWTHGRMHVEIEVYKNRNIEIFVDIPGTLREFAIAPGEKWSIEEYLHRFPTERITP